MSLSPVVTPAILDKFIGLLVPLFLAGVGGDMATARHAAARMLAAYNTETEAELSLAAEIVCFSFGALEALSSAMNPDLAPNAVLRLRGSANALHRSAHQCQRTLDRLRKERSREAAANPVPEPPLPVEALKLSEYAQTSVQNPVLALSRQQRRAAQRKLDKMRRQQAEQARRARSSGAVATGHEPAASARSVHRRLTYAGSVVTRRPPIEPS